MRQLFALAQGFHDPGTTVVWVVVVLFALLGLISIADLVHLIHLNPGHSKLLFTNLILEIVAGGFFLFHAAATPRIVPSCQRGYVALQDQDDQTRYFPNVNGWSCKNFRVVFVSSYESPPKVVATLVRSSVHPPSDKFYCNVTAVGTASFDLELCWPQVEGPKEDALVIYEAKP